MLNHNPSSIDYEELGARLRAYRIGASLQAENIADQLGVSRAAIYRRRPHLHQRPDDRPA